MQVFVTKVLIDLRMVHGEGMHGIARYALELAHRFPRMAPHIQFYGLIGPDGLPPHLGELTPRIPMIKCESAFLSAWEQPALARVLKQFRPDLFHATSFSVPRLWNGRLVVTLHDANHLAVPESQSRLRSLYYRTITAPRCQQAEAIITVSNFSRRDLHLHLRLDESVFTVIFNGIDRQFHPASPDALADFRQRRGVPETYLALVGTLKPFKNLQMIADIANRFPVPLVVLAGRGAKRALGLPRDSVELSPLSDTDLTLLYSGALATLVPSRYEGFGFVGLEAMASGSPVIASRSSCFPEILKDAALYAAPDDPNEWVDVVHSVYESSSLQTTLKEKGLARARQFDWNTCAEETLAVYQTALNKPR